MKGTLQVRKWSETSKTPFDVVYLRDGKSKFQPGAVFSTELAAEKHKAALEKQCNEVSSSENFINDHWEQD